MAVYQAYLEEADELADGPTLLFLRLAAMEKGQHVAALTRYAEQMLREAPDEAPKAEAWAAALSQRLLQAGGVGVEKPPRAQAARQGGGRGTWRPAGVVRARF